RNALCRLDAEKQGHSDTAETFLFHEARNGYLNGFLPCDQDDMVLISCLLATPSAQLTAVGWRTARAKRRVSRLPAGLTSAVAKRYSSSGLRRELEALSLSECHTRFLTVCRRLAVFNSVFFTGQLSTMSGEFSQHRAPRQPIQVFIGVNDIGLHLLGDPSKRFLYSFHYPNFNWSEIAPDTLEVRGTTKSGETTPMRLLSRQAMADRLTELQDAVNSQADNLYNALGILLQTAQPSPFPGVGGANRTGAAAGNQAPGGVDHARFFAEQITRTAQTIVALIDSPAGPRPTEPIRIRMAELEEENHRLGRHLIEVVDQLEARLRRVRACLTDIAQNSQIMYGPEPPPEFVDQPPSPSSSSKSSSKPAAGESSEATPAGLVIGPLPSEHRILDELRHAPRFQAAAAPNERQEKRSGAAREEWMLVPPETLASSLMTAGRKRPAGQPDKSWTRIGDGDEEAEAAPAEDAQAAAERRQQAALEMQGARLHDAEMERLAAAVGAGRRLPAAAVAAAAAQRAAGAGAASARGERKLRNGKRRRKRKKTRRRSLKRNGVESRPRRLRTVRPALAGVPFNRDTDMVVKGLDSKVKQSIVAKSQAGMASRFSHGGQKYL
uniref:Mediator of RNA polymerase II transcription subunit 21 n=1 Tax=Macrostomum lignano TaxID=282301 RepID=A0A1I8IZF2_9PLAT